MRTYRFHVSLSYRLAYSEQSSLLTSRRHEKSTVSAERKFDDKKGSHKDTACLSGTYTRDIACLNGKADLLNRSVDLDFLVGYQCFLVGGKAGFSQANSFTGCGGVLGYSCASGNRFTVEANNKKEFNFATFMKPASGIELGLYGNGSVTSVAAADAGASKDEGEKKESTKVALEATLATKFALDNAGTSLTTTVQANPLNVSEKLHVGLSYSQQLRNFATLTLSGEVGVTDTDYVGFGAEVEVGHL